MRIFITLLAIIGIAGCKQNPQLPAVISPYRIDIQQGNVITQEMVGKLKAGLTRSQVRYVLGSPLVADVFHGDRWDYVYLMQRQGKPDERRRLTVIFDGDKLASLEGDVVLTDKVAEPGQATLKPPVAAVVLKPAESPPAPSPKPKPAAVKPIAGVPAPTPATTKPAEKPLVASAPSTNPEPGVVAPAAWGKPAPATSAAAPAPKPEAAVPPEKPPVAATPVLKPEAGAAVPAAVPASSAQNTKPEAAKPEPQRVAAAPAPKAQAAKTDSATADGKTEQARNGVFGRLLDRIGF